MGEKKNKTNATYQLLLNNQFIGGTEHLAQGEGPSETIHEMATNR